MWLAVVEESGYGKLQAQRLTTLYDHEFSLSVAIPIHNEESALSEPLKRLQMVLDDLPGGPHEIVLVDAPCTKKPGGADSKSGAGVIGVYPSCQ